MVDSGDFHRISPEYRTSLIVYPFASFQQGSCESLEIATHLALVVLEGLLSDQGELIDTEAELDWQLLETEDLQI